MESKTCHEQLCRHTRFQAAGTASQTLPAGDGSCVKLADTLFWEVNRPIENPSWILQPGFDSVIIEDSGSAVGQPVHHILAYANRARTHVSIELDN